MSISRIIIRGVGRAVGIVLAALAVTPAQAFVTNAGGNIFASGASASFHQCGALTPGTSCEAGTSKTTAPSASGSESAGAYPALASADLTTGQLRISTSGPTYEVNAFANWNESLGFIGVAPGATAPIGVTIMVDGSYRDGSQVTLSVFNQSGDHLSPGNFDVLSADYTYNGSGTFPSPSDSVSLISIDAADTCPSCSSGSGSGDWTVFGPVLFQGEITVFGDSPNVDLSMAIFGQGYVEFENTVSFVLDVPEGVSFTSTSGVFLTAIPVPAGVWLFASALGALTLRRRAGLGSGVLSRLKPLLRRVTGIPQERLQARFPNPNEGPQERLQTRFPNPNEGP